MKYQIKNMKYGVNIMNSETTSQLEERVKILKMVEDGKVSPGEGAALLGALDQDRKEQRPERRPFAEGTRFFRVRVTDLGTGRRKATVNIPMGLMDWGFRIGAQFAPEISNFDLNEVSEMLRTGADGKIIDVLDEEDGEHVEIFIE